MSLKSLLSGGMLVAAILLYGCDGTDSEVTLITVTGSSTIAPLISEIAKQFEKENPKYRIDVQSGGSSKGLMDVRSGIADIGMVSRELKAEEADVISTMIATDGLAIITHASNPLNQITRKEVIDIYSANVTNWKDFGYVDMPITVVSKAEGRSTLEVFSHYFEINSKDIVANVIIGDNQQGIQTVAGNPGAIGYVSIGAAEYEAYNNNVAIKLLDLDGVKATTNNVRKGVYPISRQLNLITNKNKDSVKEFIKYTNSSAVKHIFESHSFIMVEPSTSRT